MSHGEEGGRDADDQEGAPADRLALAARLVREDRPDEEVERLAGVTLDDIVELRARLAAHDPSASTLMVLNMDR